MADYFKRIFLNENICIVKTLWPSDAIMVLENLVNVGSVNGLLPDGSEPSPEPTLTTVKSLI